MLVFTFSEAAALIICSLIVLFVGGVFLIAKIKDKINDRKKHKKQ